MVVVAAAVAVMISEHFAYSNLHFELEFGSDFEFGFGCAEGIGTVTMVMVMESEMTTTMVSTTGKSAEFRAGAAMPSVPPSFFSATPPYWRTAGNKWPRSRRTCHSEWTQ